MLDKGLACRWIQWTNRTQDRCVITYIDIAQPEVNQLKGGVLTSIIKGAVTMVFIVKRLNACKGRGVEIYCGVLGV